MSAPPDHSWSDHDWTDDSSDDGAAVEVRVIQPYQALKTYRCPGCDHEIRPGEGHVVVVPRDDPDERRHWHRSCWGREMRRRGS